MSEQPKYYDENSEVPLEDILKYYGMTFFCRNCEYQNAVSILKGVRASTIIIVCKKCGCAVRKDK